MDFTPKDHENHTRKKHYLTKAKAKKAIGRVRSKKGLNVRSLYRCPICGYWCITSIPRKEQFKLSTKKAT